MKNSDCTRTITALLLSFSLLAGVFMPSAKVTANTNAFPDREHPEVAEGAKQFDEAAQEIERILTLDLSTDRGEKQATAIIEKSAKKLANVEKKVIHAGMRATSFERGLKAEAAKRKGGADELVKELQSNPESVANIPGAQEAARVMRESIKPAAEKLKRVGEALTKAAEATRKSVGLPGVNFHKAAYTEPEPTLGSYLMMTSGPASFCGRHKLICDYLVRLAARHLVYYLSLPDQLVKYPGALSSCILSAYEKWKGGCRLSYDSKILNILGCNGWFVWAVGRCVEDPW